MGEISLEANAVSRFIVSLSKSIQALCHGCMDFDDTIEMIGYINISIDSGKTVDCVLNEKVRKSAANAMTCISNSFQAKKEKPKQTKDGSCSPIPQPDYSSHHTRLHKRPRNDCFSYHGLPQRKQRYRPNPISTYHPERFASSSDSVFYDQSSTTSTSSEQVKTERYDNLSSDFDMAATTSENFSVKEEQIDAPALEAQEAQNEVDNLKQESSFQNDISGQSQGSVTGKDNLPSNLKENQKNIEHFENDNIDNVETNTSFLNTAEDSTQEADSEQPHCSQEELCDDGDGQFEVIEIGDDDEDVQDLFDPAETPRKHYTSHPHRGGNSTTTTYASPTIRLSASKRTPDSQSINMSSSTNASFPTVGTSRYSDDYSAMSYEREFDSGQSSADYSVPPKNYFSCHLCGKQFTSNSGLKHHLQAHKGRQFQCHVCDNKFTLKHHLKSHLKNVHKLIQCVNCSNCFSIGDAYKDHILKCY